MSSMKFLLLLFLIIELVNANSSDHHTHKDVCILGAGASGMSAAAFLKQNGYSVVVLENSDVIGGHCNTYRFKYNGQDYWVDPGVQYFPNTTSANEAGYGPWTINSVEFVQRFAGLNSVIAVNLFNSTAPTYAADFANGISYGQQIPQPPTPEFLEALERLMIILSEYPWLDLANFPDPIPSKLLVTFSEFITTNQLQPLVSSIFNPALFGGGLGDYDKLTALYAIQNLAPTILRVFIASQASFEIRNGCLSVYEGIRDYLGTNNVLVNAHVISTIRPHDGTIILNGYINKPLSTFNYECGKLIVSFPQVLSRMLFLQLDTTEINIFRNVQQRYFFDAVVDVQGPITVDQSYDLGNVNLNTVYDTPFLPAITSMVRNLPFGPSQLTSYSNTYISNNEMLQIVNHQLNNVPHSLIHESNVIAFNHHIFQPHFSVSSLSTSPTPYTKLENLQGYRGTYYIGALKDFALSVLLWDSSLRFISEHFPSKL